MKKATPFVLILISIAGIGLVNQVTTDPLGILKQLLIWGIIGLIGYLLFKRFFLKRNGKDYQKYRKAVRYSKQKYHQSTSGHQSKKRKPSSPLKKQKRDHNLKVIEGKKGKKKNRAL